MVGYIGNQGDVASPLNGYAQCTLMLGADSGPATRLYFCPVGNKPPDLVDILVVDQLDMFYAEGTYPATRDEPPTRATAGTASWPWPPLGSTARP